jgi:hypothetical protein
MHRSNSNFKNFTQQPNENYQTAKNHLTNVSRGTLREQRES